MRGAEAETKAEHSMPRPKFWHRGRDKKVEAEANIKRPRHNCGLEVSLVSMP